MPSRTSSTCRASARGSWPRYANTPRRGDRSAHAAGPIVGPDDGGGPRHLVWGGGWCRAALDRPGRRRPGGGLCAGPRAKHRTDRGRCPGRWGGGGCRPGRQERPVHPAHRHRSPGRRGRHRWPGRPVDRIGPRPTGRPRRPSGTLERTGRKAERCRSGGVEGGRAVSHLDGRAPLDITARSVGGFDHESRAAWHRGGPGVDGASDASQDPGSHRPAAQRVASSLGGALDR